MSAYLTPGITFADGVTYPAASVNAGLAATTPTVAFINSWTTKTPVSADVFMFYDNVGNAIKSCTLANISTALGIGSVLTSLNGDVTTIGSGSVTASISSGSVTLAKMAKLPANTIIGNNTGTSATPLALTVAQLQSMILPAGSILQHLATSYTANADITAHIPSDNSIPQSGEGTEIMALTITAASTSNKLNFRFNGCVCSSSAFDWIIAAIIIDTTADAIFATQTQIFNTAGAATRLEFEWEYTPPDTNSHTYHLRVGATAGTLRLNGNGSSGITGGVDAATFIVEEIKH